MHASLKIVFKIVDMQVTSSAVIYMIVFFALEILFASGCVCVWVMRHDKLLFSSRVFECIFEVAIAIHIFAFRVDIVNFKV